MQSGGALFVHAGTQNFMFTDGFVKLLWLRTLNEWTQLECK